ncbi:hypothetical protein pdam_00000470 [Pocillopora damicornis]|uniref:Uncharacterized protein n=1 Tax=Pocillopora damicornis TaxID=46731 RepID=A0A3M6UJ70_POCDA|nr:hypothetical protein pdam_00000470 [Pocillopora damicornis]
MKFLSMQIQLNKIMYFLTVLDVYLMHSPRLRLDSADQFKSVVVRQYEVRTINGSKQNSAVSVAPQDLHPQTLQLQFGYADDSNKVTQLSVVTSTAVISKFSSSEGRPSIRADNIPVLWLGKVKISWEKTSNIACIEVLMSIREATESLLAYLHLFYPERSIGFSYAKQEGLGVGELDQEAYRVVAFQRHRKIVKCELTFNSVLEIVISFSLITSMSGIQSSRQQFDPPTPTC